MTKIDGTATAATTTARESDREFATERTQGPFELGHFVAIGVHHVEVLGQGLANGLGERLRAAVLHESLTDHPFDLRLQEVDARAGLFTRETLLSRVWGYEYYGGARTVDVHVRRLRAKLGEEHANLIQTVRSVGYKFGTNGEREA